MDSLLTWFGLILGIISILYAWYTTRLFSKGIKIGVLRSIRSIINRIEADKNKLDKDSTAWLSMHQTQEQLEVLHANLQELFPEQTHK